MSRRGNCWDNAVIESFFSSLKKERIKKRIYKTRDLARADVFDYIEVFYNRKRRHSHLGGVSPEAFEQASLWALVVSVIPAALQVFGNMRQRKPWELSKLSPDSILHKRYPTIGAELQYMVNMIWGRRELSVSVILIANGIAFN